MQVTGEDGVNAINGVFGVHPSFRAAHARGTACRGVFTPSPAAAELTSAEHMRGDRVETTVRFSNASGDPGTSDAAPDARGMAVKFQLPSGGSTDIVAVTLPSFFVRRREDFIELNNALRRGPNGPPPRAVLLARLSAFVVRHREAGTAARAMLRAKPVPSYANCRYNAIHAFEWINGQSRQYVRYSWRPEEGEKVISGSDAERRGRDYLQRDLYERLGRDPVRPIRFTLELQLASEDDLNSGRVCDATQVWPGERDAARQSMIQPAGGGEPRHQFVDAGVLELTGMYEQPDAAGHPLVFDPTNLTPGIEAPTLPDGISPSTDEILHYRPEAYAVSIERRTVPARDPS